MIFRVTRTLKINRVWLKEKNKDGKEEEKGTSIRTIERYHDGKNKSV